MRVTASCVAVLLLYYSIGEGLTDCSKCTGESCEKDCSNSSEAVNITCSPIHLPRNQCDFIDNQQECVDNQPYIGTNIYPRPYWVSCCDQIECQYHNFGLPAGRANLSHKWMAVNSKIVSLKLHWQAPSDGSASGYKLVIAHNDSHISAIDRCMCLPATLQVFTYFVNVSLSAGTSLDVKLIGYPYPSTLTGTHTTTNHLAVDIPPSCWDAMEPSYSKCGPMLFSAPQILTVVKTPVNESVVMMSIKWKPPVHSNPKPNITAYKIEIIDTRTYIIGTRCCNDSLSHGQTTCQYNFTLPVGHEYSIKVSASSCKPNNSVDVAEQDCEDISDTIHMAFNDTICWGKSSVKNISTVPLSAADNSQPPIILIIIISSLSILASLIVVIAIIIIITHTQLRRAAANPYISLVVDGDGYATQRVFVINSPQSSEDDLLLVRRLCHKLADSSVKPVNYEYLEFDRQHGPGQSGIYQWAENNFTECNMVLFVCNKNFHDAWNNGDTNQNSLISACKFLLQGHLSSNHSEDVSKFGVVLLRQTDDQYVPGLLRSLQKFVIFQDGQCVIESLLNQIS